MLLLTGKKTISRRGIQRGQSWSLDAQQLGNPLPPHPRGLTIIPPCHVLLFMFCTVKSLSS